MLLAELRTIYDRDPAARMLLCLCSKNNEQDAIALTRKAQAIVQMQMV